MRWFMLGALWVAVSPLAAQEPTAAVQISADAPATLSLTFAPHETQRIIAQGEDGLDPTLKLLDPSGAVVAFADDTHLSNRVLTDAQMTYTSAAGGAYQLRVDSFNGVSEGIVNVWIAPQLPPALTVNEPLTLTLGRQQPADISLTLDEAAHIRLTVAAVDGQVDPLVQLIDEQGRTRLAADDLTTLLPALRALDAVLTAELPAGRYRLRVQDWLRREGQVRVTLARLSQ